MSIDTAVRPRDHVAAFADTEGDLVSAVALFVARGLEAGDHVVVVARPGIRRRMVEMMRRQGFDLTGAWGGRRYVELDAVDTLSQIHPHGRIDPEAFRATVLPVVEEGLAAGRPVRVYGEMVDLLWERGEVPSAIDLEQCWNDLGRQLAFSLLCGYRRGAGHDASLGQVAATCDLHSRVVPPRSYATGSPERFEPDGGAWQSEVFLPLTASVPAARRFLRGALGPWARPEEAWDAVVVVSELAANAVLHGRSAFRVRIIRGRDTVRVGIEDAAPALPLSSAPGATATGGRGLALVEALSLRSGHDPLPEGKLVWADLALRR
jgi:hypothetical protein